MLTITHIIRSWIVKTYCKIIFSFHPMLVRRSGDLYYPPPLWKHTQSQRAWGGLNDPSPPPPIWKLRKILVKLSPLKLGFMLNSDYLSSDFDPQAPKPCCIVSLSNPTPLEKYWLQAFPDSCLNLHIPVKFGIIWWGILKHEKTRWTVS